MLCQRLEVGLCIAAVTNQDEIAMDNRRLKSKRWNEFLGQRFTQRAAPTVANDYAGISRKRLSETFGCSLSENAAMKPRGVLLNGQANSPTRLTA